MATGFAAIPDGGALSCSPTRRCRRRSSTTPPASPTRDGLCAADIVIADGRIERIAPAGSATDAPRARPRPAAWSGRAFVDMPHPSRQGPHLAAQAQPRRHLHRRARRGRARPRGALVAPTTSRARMDFALRCAYAHGTAAHPHPSRFARRRRTTISWPVFARDARALGGPDRAAGASRSSPSSSCATQPALDDARRPRRRSTAASSAASPSWCPTSSALLDDADRARAAKRGLDLDFHVDETGDPAAPLAPTHRRGRAPQRLPRAASLAGHCCSLAVQADDEARRDASTRVAEAGIAVVSLPMCNMYLQDRRTRRHARRAGAASRCCTS